MLKAAFILLRVLTAIASFGALAGTVLAILITSAFELIKGGARAIFAVAKLFASGFQKSSPIPPHDHLISLPLSGIDLLFLIMCVSVFLPDKKIFLHVVAAFAVVAAGWRIGIMAHQPDTPMLYLPTIALWFLYFAACLYKSSYPVT